MNIIEIVHDLRRAKGKAKLSVLMAHSHNKNWLRFLVATYDRSINYYTSASYDDFYTVKDADEPFYALLDDLSSGALRGNAGKKTAKYLSETYGEIGRLVLRGSINAGVSTTSINKIYHGLIRTFDLMLANSSTLTKFPCLASIKFDGVRVVVKVLHGKAIAYTRSGKVLNLVQLTDSLKDCLPGMYDGELVLGAGLQSGRTTISGQVNRVLSGTSTAIEGYVFNMFDYVSNSDWENKESTLEFHNRQGLLLKSVGVDLRKGLAVAEQRIITSTAELTDLYSSLVTQGYEGLIVRWPEDPYVWSRSSSLIKLKAIKDGTLNCVGVKLAENNKYAGLIGALVCEGVVEGRDIKVNLGSGLTDAHRSMDPSVFIGKVIDLEYNDVVKAQGSPHYSLFLGRFKRIVG